MERLLRNAGQIERFLRSRAELELKYAADLGVRSIL